LTHVTLTALYPLGQHLELTAGGLATWTVLDEQRPLLTVGAQAGLTARLGRITAQLQYQFVHSETAGVATSQHFLRLFLSRPFEF
jgi:hypothetical protein